MNIIEELEKLIESHYNEEIDSRDEWLREVISLKEKLVNKTNDIHDVSELFSAKDMKDFAANLSGKKVGDLDLILFKNNR